MALFVVQANSEDEAGLARARVLLDGFSWAAFILGQFWLLYCRLWMALIIWIALEVAYILTIYPHVPGVISSLLDLLAHVFVGFEGNRLRQQKGARTAVLTDLIEAHDRDEAEAIFYRRHMAAEA